MPATHCDRPELVSSRLRFDRWNRNDFALLYELHADQRIQRGYPWGPDAWTVEKVQEKLEAFIFEQEASGFCKWKLSLEDGTFVGRAGWSRWSNEELEIGYAIKPDFQGRGYALEASRTLIGWANQNRAERLIGFALLSNAASRRILERSGMSYDYDEEVHGAVHTFYSVR